MQKSFNIKIAKKKVRIKTPLVNPIIDLERPLEKVLKKGESQDSMISTSPAMEEDHLRSGLSGKTNYSRP